MHFFLTPLHGTWFLRLRPTLNDRWCHGAIVEPPLIMGAAHLVRHRAALTALDTALSRPKMQPPRATNLNGSFRASTPQPPFVMRTTQPPSMMSALTSSHRTNPSLLPRRLLCLHKTLVVLTAQLPGVNPAITTLNGAWPLRFPSHSPTRCTRPSHSRRPASAPRRPPPRRISAPCSASAPAGPGAAPGPPPS